MSRFHLAQANVGRLRAPMDHPDTADFADGLDPINARADAAPGFVWRLQDESGNATAIETPGGDPMRIINVSVWESVEALRAFTYAADHVAYLRRRREWFHDRDGPHLAMWWVPVGHEPTVEEAEERLAELARSGPGERAFTFADPRPPPA